jgi:hypothetical protein
MWGQRMKADQKSEATIETELRTERPQWLLSSFGAAKYEPCLFFGYELSPEELRWKSVQALREGQPQQYVSTSCQQTLFILTSRSLKRLDYNSKHSAQSIRLYPVYQRV